MKVIAINGSPNKQGNTYHAIQLMAEELEKEGIEVEVLQVGSSAVKGCIGCNMCAKNRNEKCVLPGDDLNEWVQKMKQADGIIIASPVYYSGISGTMKSFLDRAFYVASSNGSLFRHKAGAAITAVRRSGGVTTFDQLNHYLMYSEMVIPTSNYWNVIHGTRPGEVLQDEEGVQIMKVLAKNMAWVVKLIDQGKWKVEAPEKTKKTYTNFIR